MYKYEALFKKKIEKIVEDDDGIPGYSKNELDIIDYGDEFKHFI
jgi:hypothetical protein